jgi:cupin 2 domain-containing protein
MSIKKNIFQLPSDIPEKEIFESLLTTQNVAIERIISTGQSTPPGQWYDQETDEWVILLQGNAQLSYEDGQIVELSSGDYLFLKAHEKHRVEATSTNPVCIWLAIHLSSQ